MADKTSIGPTETDHIPGPEQNFVLKVPGIKVTPATLSFTVEEPQQTITITNTGTADLHVTSLAVTGSYATWFKVAAPTSFTLAPAKAHTVQVSVHVLGANRYAAETTCTLTIHGNVADAHVTLKKKAEPNPNVHPSSPGNSQPEPVNDDPSNVPSPSGDGWGIGGGGCFAPGTLVLMADGSVKPVEEIGVGDAILTVSEGDHQASAAPEASPATIEAVLRHDGGHAVVDLDGIVATPVHRWAVRDDARAGFLRTDRLVAGVTDVRIYGDGVTGWRKPHAIRDTAQVPVVYNFTTSAHTYLVAADAAGPWHVVHNDKIANPDEDPKPPGNP